MYLVLLCIWIILNGRITLEIFAFGMAICALLYLFVCKFTDFSVKKDIGLMRRFSGILTYAYVLVKEIIKANLAVIHLIVSGRDEIEPVLVSFKSKLKSNAARAFMANAITLTPGTITVSLEDDEYMVHCLDKDLAEGMDQIIFTELLESIEQSVSGKQKQRSRKEKKHE